MPRRVLASSALIASALVGLAGCGGAPPARAAQALPEEPASGLVWFVDAQGRHRTLWVSTAEGRPLSSLPIDGPLWAEGSMLWQWTEEPVEVPLVECAPLGSLSALGAAEGATRVIGSATAHRVILRELTHSLALEVRGAPMLEPVRALSHGVEPVASVGPYLFAVEELRYDPCSASTSRRPSAEARTLVWDLTSARPAEVLTDDERQAVASAARARLEEQGLEEAEPLALAGLTPSWDPARGLSLDYLFVAESCPGCGAHVRAASLPDTLRARARVPRWVRAALARVEGATLRGFSRLDHPAPLRVLDSLRR